MDHNNISVEGLVYLATRMRPFIFLQNDPISLAKLTSQIEREHPGFRGKFKPFRKEFHQWLNTPIVATMTLGQVPPELQTDTPQVLVLQP